MKPLKTVAALALTLCAVLPLLTVGGCKGRENAIAYEETEASYLRYPGDVAKTMLPGGSKPLFPLGVGSHWEMRALQAKVQAPTEGQGQRTLTAGEQGTETIRVVKQIPVGGQTGTLFELTSTLTPVTGGAAKNTVRQEIYGVTKNGLYLMGAGTGQDRMTMSPPIPLLPYPAKVGQTASWSGVLHYKKVSAPATCVSRFTNTDTVRPPYAPKGVATYRVDTVLTTTVVIKGKNTLTNFPATRWLVPGVGLVREKLLSGDIIITKDLKSFEIKGN